MSETALVWNADLISADWRLTGNGGLETAPAIHTAVWVSLFTDRRAHPDDMLPPGETDRRGWWGGQIEGLEVGSRLWLLRRAKHLPETLKLARDYIDEALAWLIEDGLAAKVEASTWWDSAARMGFRVILQRNDGTRETVTGSWAWKGA